MAQGRPHLSSLFYRIRGRIETRRPLLHSREPCPETRISPGSWQALPLETSAGQTQGFAPRNQGEAPTVDTLREAEVEPLYKLLLRARNIWPPARPEPVCLVHHPRYCAYHQFVGHATRKCRALKEHLEGLI